MAAPTITSSVLTGGSNSHTSTSEEVNGVATDFVSEGIVGSFTNTSGVAPSTGAFAVNASGTPDANINISTGVAYVTATPTSQNSQTFRIKCSTAGTLAISSNSSGSTKYDWIYISISATNAANPNVAGDNVATVVASRSTSASTDDGTPPTYGYPIAVVTVANGFTTITNGNIRDVRANSIVNLGSSSVSSGWLDLGYTPTTVTANGNRSYSLVFNSTDLTSTLSNGMRLKLSRLVTAPTQCTDLESGSSQYYSKSSPNGMTFTDDFTCVAWVKLESYGAQIVMSRYNGTNGWRLWSNTDGTVLIDITNTGRRGTSYQSLPLNKWVHVAASMDASAGSALIYFDGVLVPSATSGASTSLTQAGNLEIGSQNGGANPFDGKIAQAAVFSAVLSAATIRSYMNQTLSGSETSLVSAYSFNNSINDLNANANNLTANGSAVATNADSPFAGGSVGTTEYGIITANAFSTNTTLTVQVPEGYAIPTSGGVSAVSYSTQKVPYGFPTDSGKWRISSLLRTAGTVTSNATFGAFLGGGYALTAPIGAWKVGHIGGFTNATTTTVTFSVHDTALTGLTVAQAHDIGAMNIFTKASAAANTTFYSGTSVNRNLSVSATFVMYTLGATTGAVLDGAATLTEIFAEFNLL